MILTLLAADLLSAGAIAAEPAYYHPDKVAGGSTLFAQIAEGLGPQFETLQGDLGRDSASIDALERATLLLGDRASSELTDYAESTRRTLVHQYLQAQAHVSLIEEDTSTTFTEALERAMAELAGQYDMVECNPGTSLESLMGPGRRAGERCDGSDVNEQLARAMDADPALAAAVAELNALEWPGIGVQGAPQAAVPLAGSDGYLQLFEVSEALIGDRLEDINRDLDRALRPLDLEDPDGLQAAEAARADYEAAVAGAGADLLEAVGWYLEKKGPAAGVCANPESLGGCEGADRTGELLSALKESKKVGKMLE